MDFVLFVFYHCDIVPTYAYIQIYFIHNILIVFSIIIFLTRYYIVYACRKNFL